MLRIISAMFAVAFLSLALHAALTSPEPMNPKLDTIPGIYAVVGKDQENDYTGTTMIRPHGEGYSVQSMIATETEKGAALGTSLGVGLRDGDKLVVAWSQGRITGVTIFTIGKDGSLTGKWLSIPGNDEVRKETLTRIGNLPKIAQ